MPDWDGEQYAQASELQRTMAARALEGFAPDPHDHVLDVGCGDGFVTRTLASRLTDGYVVGVDASPRMIEKAMSGEADPRVRFAVADARRLPFRDRFDVVVSFNALHWVPEQQQALASIADAARPDARVLIQMVCDGDRESLETIAMEVAGTPRWVDRFAGFAPPYVHVDPDDYPGLAADAGLRVTALMVDDVTWDFGSREAFAQWCAAGADAWTHRLDPDDRPRFVDDWVRAYEDVSGRPGLFRFMQMRTELEVSR
ncbi:class I SAM-dependent methyltransferase [Prescottella defluvii]|uniref:class I SAM-dependent methyltransferase n=1 Tax=Prescottella defluvii TaxID=1323361 RepID=UPI0004F2641B|nr:class I SAM-dependent methyltransferase [Prescottella defluvii]